MNYMIFQTIFSFFFFFNLVFLVIHDGKSIFNFQTIFPVILKSFPLLAHASWTLRKILHESLHIKDFLKYVDD